MYKINKEIFKYILQLNKLLYSLKVDTIESIDNTIRFWILVAGCSMFIKFTLGELLIIQDQVSSIQYRFHNAAV